MSSHGAIIAASGDGERSVPTVIERKTRGGRTLRYRLTILQQPERARACGSGSKSNTDRRPVDPPPVVELRIFEVTPTGAGVGGPKEMKDITFQYNANFFVFTSLELARPMAHGRVQTPAATSAPVLTGVPVSGMAYLDRPEEAGYFLFPDLSIRHEGRYKLAFTLYEETKDECNFDAESSPDDKAVDGPAFCYRMEIKSDPFTVFSAKKFPGLGMSTCLSRTVADQGCRVRIRREVRARKRDNDKGETDFSRRRTRTPEMQQSMQQAHEQYRQRSLSATSDHGRLPYDQSRRPSGVETYPAPPPPPGPPVAYAHQQPASNLNFDASPMSHCPHPGQYGIATGPTTPTTPTHASSHPSPHHTPRNSYSRPSSQHIAVMPPSPQSVKMETLTSPHGKVQLLPSIGTNDPRMSNTLPPISNLLNDVPSNKAIAGLMRHASHVDQGRNVKSHPHQYPAPPVRSNFQILDNSIPIEPDTNEGLGLGFDQDALIKPNSNGKRDRSPDELYHRAPRDRPRPSPIMSPKISGGVFSWKDADNEPRRRVGPTFR